MWVWEAYFKAADELINGDYVNNPELHAKCTCSFYFSVSLPELETPLDKLPVTLLHDGTMYWYPSGLFHTYCQVNMFNFPFDIQTCYINITCSKVGKVILKGAFHNGSFSQFYENTMWTLIDYKVHNFFSVISLELTLKRQSSYFLMTTIMPLILLSVVGLMVFPLPPDSGEKVTLSVTCLMSFFLTQLSITEHMPTSWTSMPIISKCNNLQKCCLEFRDLMCNFCHNSSNLLIIP